MDYTIQELAQISATQHPGVDESAIHEAEISLGGKFPKDFRDLVKLVNGAEFFDWNFFPIKDPKNPAQTWDDIVQHNKSELKPRFLLPDYIAFAESMGDYLCFKIVDGVMEDTIYLHGEETISPEAVAPDLQCALLEIMSYADEEDEDEDFFEDEDEDEEEQ